jgi:hypothetical protein
LFVFSDLYRIQDMYGDTIYDLTLNQISDESLLETFGLERVLSSMAMQRQEEVDIFFGDAVCIIFLTKLLLSCFFFFEKKIDFLIFQLYISQEI